MQRSRWVRVSSRAALSGAVLLLLTSCSTSDIEKRIRWGWPTGVTKQAERMRVLWSWSGVAALVLGVIVWGLIFWCCIRYRKRNDELPRQTKYNFVVEIICFTVPLVIIAGLFWRTVVVENYVNKLSANPDVRVQVDAFKWNWQFEYHSYKGQDGQQHQTVYKGEQSVVVGDDNPGQKQTCDEAASNQSTVCGASTDDASGNPLYFSTVGSQNEIPVLVIPVDKKVRIVEHSEDVIHSFWVPEFLFKRDVIPYGTTSTARDNQFEIVPTHIGRYVGRCAELCGTYHSAMNFEVRVVSEQTFEDYLKALGSLPSSEPQRQAKALRAAGMPAYATTTFPLQSDRTARRAAQKP